MNPIFFFVIIIVIDLILKSSKNKKKVEQARRQRTGEMNRTAPSPKSKSIMQTIREEMEKEAQKASDKVVRNQPPKRMVQQKVYTEDQFISHDNSAELKETEIKNRSRWNHEDVFSKPKVKEVVIEEKTQAANGRKNALKSDIIKGIIFSEIISEPKSLKNQRKSM